MRMHGRGHKPNCFSGFPFDTALFFPCLSCGTQVYTNPIDSRSAKPYDKLQKQKALENSCIPTVYKFTEMYRVGTG